jgi:hypothetical protein
MKPPISLFRLEMVLFVTALFGIAERWPENKGGPVSNGIHQLGDEFDVREGGEVHEGDIRGSEVSTALVEVNPTLDEVHSEVAERLEEVDWREWIGGLREQLEPYGEQVETARLIGAALACIETVIKVKDGEAELDPEAVVQLVAFALQAYEYIDKEHYLGDLERAADQLRPVLDRYQ